MGKTASSRLVAPIDDTPAAKGPAIRAGDIITHIDDEAVAGASPSIQAVEKDVAGAVNSKIRLKGHCAKGPSTKPLPNMAIVVPRHHKVCAFGAPGRTDRPTDVRPIVPHHPSSNEADHGTA